MIGLVVVSHSRPLARAAVALAQEMLHGRGARIAIAAGLDETTLGTDATEILEAIGSADQGEGVVVLMDLGSAVLSAELAVDLLDERTRERVVLCPAPLVEGLVVAAVAASSGASLHEVAAEAAGALAGKVSHVASNPPMGADTDQTATNNGDRGTGELVGVFTVTSPHGLHARPAARIVQEIRRLDARAHLRNHTTGSDWVPASSLSKVATLGALRGHEIDIRVSGGQAREALDHVLALAARGFDEDDEHTDAGDRLVRNGSDGASPVEPAAAGGQGSTTADAMPVTAHHGPLGASPGIGIGPARSLRSGPIELPDTPAGDPADEWRGLSKAIAAVRRNIQEVRARTARELGEAQAAIFDAHLLLLDDPDLLDRVRTRLENGAGAAAAWAATITDIGGQLAALPDPYLRARAEDISAVGEQVLRALLGLSGYAAGTTGVLVAADLTPAEAAKLDNSRVTAVLLAYGSPRAHSAILLRAKAIPAVVSAGPAVLDIAEHTRLAVDGTRGEFAVDPSARTLRDYRTRAAESTRRADEARAHAHAPATTQDGVEIHVGANLGSVEDARLAATLGADLAGLVRTEFVFLGRTQAPDVDEQEAIYRSIADALGGRRITLRTLDVGGDKPLDYLRVPHETNPYLGVRGIRLSLAHPRLLADQLLAIVRVAHETPVNLMFPMISTVDELRAARTLLEDAIERAGRGRPVGLKVGIMIEVPAAALKSASFARHVDFFSIGTNDLTQYALAADRGNDALASLSDPLDPGVLRLVHATCQGANGHAAVAVCGEVAADEHAAAVLVGLGVRELSVTPHAIPTTKQAARAVDTERAAALAQAALRAENARAVRELLDPPSPATKVPG
jgi:multiphosphoryl transfer protein